MAEETETPQAPALTPEQSLASQYDVGDTPEAASLGVMEPEGNASTPPATPEPPAHEHPSWLVQMALDQGFSDDDIATTPTSQLGTIVQRVQANVQRIAAERQREQGHAEGTRRQQRQPEPPPPEEDDVDLGLSESEQENFTPELLGLLKKVVKAPLKRVKQLEQQLAQRDQFETEQRNLTRNQQIDKAIASLGMDKAFGKGSGPQVKNRDPEAFQNRLKLIARVDAIAQTEQAMGNSFDFETELASMARYMFKEDAVPEGKTQRQQEWDEAGVARPTQRQPSPEPPGVNKARKSVAKALERQAQAAASVPANPEANGTATLDDFLE